MLCQDFVKERGIRRRTPHLGHEVGEHGDLWREELLAVRRLFLGGAAASAPLRMRRARAAARAAQHLHVQLEPLFTHLVLDSGNCNRTTP